MKKIAAVFLAIALAVGFMGCSEEKLDPRELADALAEEFADEIEFENGTKQDGAPPEEHAGDANYPQITPGGVDAPLTVVYDNWFDITLQTFFTPDTEVVGAVVHIMQANKDDSADSYIEVIPVPPALSNNTMTLRARVMNPGAQLGGNAFMLRIAMIRDDGAGLRGVGNYATVYLLTPQVGASAPRVPQCTCPDGKIKTVGGCTDQIVLEELNDMPCGLWASALTPYNGNMQAHEEASGAAEMPSGTRADAWWGDPVCTVELECP